MSDPLAELNEPTHKEIARITCYFVGNTAQEFTLEVEDNIERMNWGWRITHAKDGMEEDIFEANLCFMRKRKMLVKIFKPRQVVAGALPPDGGDA